MKILTTPKLGLKNTVVVDVVDIQILWFGCQKAVSVVNFKLERWLFTTLVHFYLPKRETLLILAYPEPSIMISET